MFLKARSKRAFLILALAISCFALSVVPIAAQTLPYEWTAPSAAKQLENDTAVIPTGSGAIFVPAMSDGPDEPQVIVQKDGKTVASGSTGQRIAVRPGSYTILVGSGALNRMTVRTVQVVAGRDTVVDPDWAGLKIEVVDTSNIPFAGLYEVIRMSDRLSVGIGYGADSLQGESLTTWLLEPGLYRIVRAGETYRARRDFATVDLPRAGLVHFKLVLDETTGDFRGAGVVSADELGVASAGSNWTRRVTLGGAVSLSSTDNVVGATNQQTLNGLAFLDAYFTYDDDKNVATTIVELEEGVLAIDPEIGKSSPTQKTQDRLRLDSVYTRFLNDRWGPYARFGLLTNVFPSEVLATNDTSVAFNRLDGTREVQAIAANSEFRTSDGFGALRVREGFGANVRLFRNRWATLNWRGGVGFRQNLFNDAFVLRDDNTTAEVDYFEVDNFNEEGVETSLTGSVRLYRNLFWVTDLEVFADFGEFGDPTIDWRNTLSLRLSRSISIDYTADILDQPQVSPETQFRQNILLRFSLDLF